MFLQKALFYRNSLFMMIRQWHYTGKVPEANDNLPIPWPVAAFHTMEHTILMKLVSGSLEIEVSTLACFKLNLSDLTQIGYPK